MKYMLIAGEASGDLHASLLIEALRRADPDASFVIIGGDLMAKAAGCEPIIHYRRMAFMGFSEVLRNLKPIFNNLKTAQATLVAEKPDALILIDYPSFNLKVARKAHSLGIPCYWYISPKLWAWKQWRVKAIRKLIRKVLCILPFEPEWFRAHGYDGAVYVGNPTVDEIDKAIAEAPSRKEFLEAHRLRDRRILALLPGSRRGEIRCNLPVMDAVARQFPQYTIVVAGAPEIPDELYASLTKFPVLRNATHHLLAHAHAALVTSGTATLECAIAAVPQVVTYRSNGSKLAYNLMKKLLHVDYVALPNLIASNAVVPELLLHFCTPEKASEELGKITPDGSPDRMTMLRGYAEVGHALDSAGNSSAQNAARIIFDDLLRADSKII